jgi:hypothetical protein
VSAALTAKGPCGRAFHAAVIVADTCIVVIGGRTEHSIGGDVHVIDVETETRTQPSVAHHHRAAAGGPIFVIGSLGNAALRTSLSSTA